ncbi:MAG: hypothetical protein ACT4O6_14005 [Reyranella sp.]
MRFSVLIGASLLLAACAGRAPNPVAVVQPQDRYMDCAAISAEVQANNKKISELGGDEGSKVAQNVIVGVAGVFIPILWFGMDFQGTAPKEIAALQSRQQYLGTMAESRCGAVVPLPVQSVPAATPAVVAPAATPVAAPMATPAGAQPELDCVDPAGVKYRINGTSCPPPSVPVN